MPKKYKQFKGIDSMHYPQYQRCVAVLFLFGLLLQSCKSGFHPVMEKPNPPMKHKTGNHGPDSTTSIPAMGPAPVEHEIGNHGPDSITSIPAMGPAPVEHEIGNHGPDSITSVSAMSLVPDSVTSVSAMAIGPKEWKQYFGEVGSAPPLPANIDKILNSPCPFWPERRVKDTHLLVLVPATVDGIPFTLNLLGELIKSPKGGGSKTKYMFYDPIVVKELGAQSPGSSYWVLMTRDVLPGSRDKTYDAQKALAAAHAHYDMPYALEAATAILLHHARTGERLYTDVFGWTYTRCQERVFPKQCPVVVGRFSSEGLSVHYSEGGSSIFSGVSCLRKF